MYNLVKDRGVFMKNIQIISKNTVIIGSGASGFNSADRLFSYGQKDIAIVTEHINAGTSRNTGSDKQTYYKLTLAGDQPDSVENLAKTLFQGGCVDGDIALAEASLSAMSFLKLCEIGVPFPTNRFGEYVGYKTDHDPSRRATSVGPYTSKKMTECLEQSVKNKGIEIFDKHQVVSLFVENEKIHGILCLKLDKTQPEFVLFNCENVIFATGGPAGMYKDSVFPCGHYGATGLALEKGVLGKNLTEWQFGLSSIKPRWNVSGTYMQSLPRFISTDQNGGDEKEFLLDFFGENLGDMHSKIFLKGYQWPFDCRKVDNGSSIIDILVYIESYIKNRRIFIDFRENTGAKNIDFEKLDKEALDYLEKATATFGKPIDRLLHMNQPAVDFYKDKGVDLKNEMLEIALCAQHNNGGLSIDSWWQTNIDGLFAVGEASGSHGVYRPGGSALNAGQVGSTRASQYISQHKTKKPKSEQEFLDIVEKQVQEILKLSEKTKANESNVSSLWDEAMSDMSKTGGAIRNAENIAKLVEKTKQKLANFDNDVKCKSLQDLAKAFRYKDALICQTVYLSAMLNYVENCGKSRGSALYFDPKGVKPYNFLSDEFTFSLEDGSLMDKVQEVRYNQGKCEFSWRKVRQIPKEDDFFENVWKTYRQNKNIY